jgi:hypothetical protein
MARLWETIGKPNGGIMKRNIALKILVMIFVIPFVVGCQKEVEIRAGRARISGNVSYRGAPLPGGEVSLGLASNPMIRGSAMIDENGKFSFLDAPVGLVKITVRTSDLKTEQSDRYVDIPQKYSNAEKSGLRAEVKAGENEPLILQLE